MDTALAKPKKSATPGSWKPGQSGNPNGSPRFPLSLTGVAREVVDARQLVQTLWSISQGHPIVRYRDRTGVPCMKPLDDKGQDGVVVEVVYPTVAEMTAAGKHLWERLEPRERRLMVEMFAGGQRPKVQLSGEKLDKYIELMEQAKALESGDEEDEDDEP